MARFVIALKYTCEKTKATIGALEHFAPLVAFRLFRDSSYPYFVTQPLTPLQM